jgi:predicted house-cleaning NTP pyrophosphatase (Maf/HAM1 superfamily)
MTQKEKEGDFTFISPSHMVLEKSISYSQAVEVIKNLSGKVFTLLDAVIVNDRQLKALKDSIRNDIATSYSRLYDIVDPVQSKNVPVAGVDFDEADLQEVSLEEAVGI